MSLLTNPQIERALGISRHTGAPLLGCLLNLAVAPSLCGGVGLQADDGRSEVIGLLDIAVAADFALGYSVRQAMQQLRRALPTIGLAVNLTANLPATGAVRVSAAPVAVHPGNSLSSAAGLIHSSAGTLLGHCSAMFAGPSGPLVEPLPWELPPSSSEAPRPSSGVEQGDIDGAGSLIREAVEQARERRGSWLDVLLGLVSPVTTSGVQTVRAILDTIVVANRSGFVQGGVLFAMGATSPVVSESAEPICGDMRFVRPARADLPLSIETSVEHRGRRTEFASSRLYQDDVLVASGSFTFRCQ